MSSLALRRHALEQEPAPALPRLALVGTGTVGTAFVARYQRLRDEGLSLPRMQLLCNARGQVQCDALAADALRQAVALPRTTRQSDLALASFAAGDVVVDATASDSVAEQHPRWLQRGIHVVTANKLGNGASLTRARMLADAQSESGARYGDSATVGAGLPLLRSIRALVAGGDRIHALEGLLSGSLGWLFNGFDGMRPFSGFVREAATAGYTEPDPRIDLSGQDVARKLLILARAAGIALEASAIRVDSLVPPALAQCDIAQLDTCLPMLDLPLRARFQSAWRNGERLRFMARLELDAGGCCHASVGLCALPASHPLCSGSGTDNRVAIHSCRYRRQPLVIQGPGAGADVTAAALLDDVLQVMRDN